MQEVKAKMLELASERLGLRCKTPSPLLELASEWVELRCKAPKLRKKLLVPATVQLEVRCKTLPAICGAKLRKSWPVPAPVQLGARCKTPVLREILLELATVQLRVAVQGNQS